MCPSCPDSLIVAVALSASAVASLILCQSIGCLDDWRQWASMLRSIWACVKFNSSRLDKIRVVQPLMSIQNLQCILPILYEETFLEPLKLNALNAYAFIYHFRSSQFLGQQLFPCSQLVRELHVACSPHIIPGLSWWSWSRWFTIETLYLQCVGSSPICCVSFCPVLNSGPKVLILTEISLVIYAALVSTVD